jgi:alpha-tubulin suppressor-like RCC1 family protein
MHRRCAQRVVWAEIFLLTQLATAVLLVDVVAGNYYTCVLTNNGSTMCWGLNNYGQLGYGHTVTIGNDELPFVAGFVNTGMVAVAQLAAGAYHTCALTINGSVLCWGSNGAGQLGYGNLNDIGDNELPVSAGYVQFSGTATIVQVTAGAYFSCSLTSFGSVTCWGFNGNGELGLGHTSNIGDNELPSVVGFINLGGAVVTRLSTGLLAGHTCALIANGSAICWGSNSNGQLGYGHVGSVGDDEYPYQAGFVSVGASVVFSDIRAGGFHTCGLTTNGSVK